MAVSKRKKPSRAERKVKTQKRQAKMSQAAAPAGQASMAAAVPVAQSQSFDQILQRAAGRKLVLHIGCRLPNENRLHDGFKNDQWFELRLDRNPAAQAHIVSDMRDLSMLPNESVDAIFTSHNLDSVPAPFMTGVFQEFWRVLKWGGQIGFAVPDMQTVATYVAHDQMMQPIYDSPAGPVAPIDLMYGFRLKQERGRVNVRQTAFTATSMVEYLRLNGFTNIMVSRKWVELLGSAFKYKDGDERRRESVERRIAQKNNQMEMPAPLALNRVPHPGQFAPNILSDELDIPPKYWKPLGLKDKT